MTYPKDKLDASDAAGWYIAKSTANYVEYTVFWDGEKLWAAIMVGGLPTMPMDGTVFTNFRPVAPAPEVVEGPAELPRGNWLIGKGSHCPFLSLDPLSSRLGRALSPGETALRIPDAWLAALTKPKPPSFGTELASRLKHFAELLESGKPIDECCRVTKIVQNDDGSLTLQVTEPRREPKSEPVVTEKHREAAKKLAEVSPDDDAELLREYERILAGCFPAEAAK